ncbi:hypothetical protein HT051_07325 [Methyloligella sp. GL2]|nr:hypothetical protein HT051_07325 [Methyloligella sp. GL2]
MAATPAAAEDASITSLDGWEIQAGSYAWLPWGEGNVTARGVKADVYATPGDFLDAMKMTASFQALAKRDKLSLYGDAFYVDLGYDGDVLKQSNPIGNLTVKAQGRGGLDLRFSVYDVGARYQMFDVTTGYGDTSFSLGGGARFVNEKFNMHLGVDVTATRNLTQRVDQMENRIGRIQNRSERVAALAQLNALRQAVLDQRVINAQSARILKRRAARLENRLNKVTRRGQAIAAIEAVEDFRTALLEERVELANRDFNGDIAVVRSSDTYWADPVISGQFDHDFGNGQSLTLMGDLGGFNANDDFSWQVFVSYQKETTLLGFDTTAIIGYRALGLLYDKTTGTGTTGLDLVLHGPVAELAFRW